MATSLVALLALVSGCGNSGARAGGAATTSTTAATTSTTAATTSTTTATTSTTTSPNGGGVEGSEPSDIPKLPAPSVPPSLPTPSTDSARVQFIHSVFNDIQSTWSKAFEQAHLPYSPATLRIFTSAVGTACGAQTSEVGPFYCPADKTVNLDLRFFDVLWQQTGAGGDFAEAYIIAHEMGHHIQNLLGISTRVHAANEQNPAGANALSVRVELQADCLAGVWAHTAYTRNLLQPGDLENALKAAAVVGDDFLQKASKGQVEPESWTHGSSAQRQHWLTVGFESGSVSSCDTFSAQI